MRELKRKTEENPRTRRAKRLILLVAIITIFATFSAIINREITTLFIMLNYCVKSSKKPTTSLPYILDNQTRAEYLCCHQDDE